MPQGSGSGSLGRFCYYSMWKRLENKANWVRREGWESGLREERAEERICLVRRLYDRGMNSAQISELIGLDKEQVEEMLQTKSNFENNG